MSGREITLNGEVYIPKDADPNATVIILQCPPLYAQWHVIKQLFTALTPDKLKRLHQEGYVRGTKEGEAKQSNMSYCVEDIRRCYDLRASGKKLKRVRSVR